MFRFKRRGWFGGAQWLGIVMAVVGLLLVGWAIPARLWVFLVGAISCWVGLRMLFQP